MIDHDRLFKELISSFFLDFLQLFLPDVRAFVESGSINFLDKEIFFDATEGGRLETDLIVKVKFKQHPAFFIIHIENQSQPQKAFGRRLFRYFARLHDKHDLPIYPIVIFSFDSPRKVQPNEYRVEFPNKVVMDFNYDVVQLNRLNWRDFVDKPNPVAAALMSKMNIASEDRARVKLECLRLLVTLKLNPAKMKLISGFIDNYLNLNKEQQQEFDASIQKLAVEEAEEVMEIVTSWMKEGLRKGREQGKREGIEQGRREGIGEGQTMAIVDILETRFKRIPAEMKKAVMAIDDHKQLRRLLREAVTVSSLNDFRQRLISVK